MATKLTDMNRSNARFNFSYFLFSSLLFGAVLLVLPSELQGQTTIWTEDFTGETNDVTGSGGITLTGDQWSATATSSIPSTLDVAGGDFSWSTANSGQGSASYSCTWTSAHVRTCIQAIEQVRTIHMHSCA